MSLLYEIAYNILNFYDVDADVENIGDDLDDIMDDIEMLFLAIDNKLYHNSGIDRYSVAELDELYNEIDPTLINNMKKISENL
jgi:hypothetical protein